MSKESQDKRNKEYEEFVDNFIEFISDSDDLKVDEIDRNLKLEGIDISGLIKNVQQIVDDVLEADRLSWQQKAISSRRINTQKFTTKNPLLLKLSREELLARFNSLFQSKDPDFSFAHRNLKPEKMTEEELREILSEYEQLEEE